MLVPLVIFLFHFSLVAASSSSSFLKLYVPLWNMSTVHSQFYCFSPVFPSYVLLIFFLYFFTVSFYSVVQSLFQRDVKVCVFLCRICRSLTSLWVFTLFRPLRHLVLFRVALLWFHYLCASPRVTSLSVFSPSLRSPLSTSFFKIPFSQSRFQDLIITLTDCLWVFLSFF